MATLREIIDNSNYAVFFGGAGVSTASNIPDFRGKIEIPTTLTSEQAAKMKEFVELKGPRRCNGKIFFYDSLFHKFR